MGQVEINHKMQEQIHDVLLNDEMPNRTKFYSCMIGIMTDISENLAIIADKLTEENKCKCEMPLGVHSTVKPEDAQEGKADE